MRSIITVENLSKEYRLGTRGASYGTLRDSVVRTMRSPFKQRQPNQRNGKETIWALKEVNFEVKPGETVGIIGRNGAGKSTLLKVLSRIVEPTTGNVKLYGRVGSLLEVGTGFHPELSGRENIYLNGAILGMKRTEIEAKFDEIVAFAEIEKFIDTPVKHYSSGMYMRLAFAVAAHLEPEILIIDEVLAVGDAAFQKKCLGKIDDVAKHGRTVLFVSHNQAAISRLCLTAIYLECGELVSYGNTREVISKYMSSADSEINQWEWPDLDSAPGDEYIKALSVQILDADQRPTNILRQDEAFIISITYCVLMVMPNANVGFELKAGDGTIVFWSFDADHPDWIGQPRKVGTYTANCLIPANFLNEGVYRLTLIAGIPFFRSSIMAEDIIKMNIGPSETGEGTSGRLGVRRPGVLAPQMDWQITYLK